MPLPFDKSRKVAGLIIQRRTAEGKKDERSADEDYDIEACAEDLIRAVAAKNPKSVARALRDAFEILESKPHREGPHTK